MKLLGVLSIAFGAACIFLGTRNVDLDDLASQSNVVKDFMKD